MYELQAWVTGHYTKGQPKAWRTVARDEDLERLKGMIPGWSDMVFRIIEVRIPQRTPRKDLANKGVGERLNKILKEKGITPFQAAVRCDVYPSKIYGYLKGTFRPRKSTVEKIAKGLGISVEDLTGETYDWRS